MARKPIEQKNLRPSTKKQIEELNLQGNLNSSGINCGNLVEPNPALDQADCEVVLANENNAAIVLGRDRPANKTGPGGYGPLGQTGCGSVDIVVGRMAGTTGGPDSNFTVSPNFFTDAARIYVSQKTDVDKNFALVGDGQLAGVSAVGIKADGVRIIGRNGVKIVTGKGKNIKGTGLGGERDSQGDKIELIQGIELIAGNDVEVEKLEPIVKAYALAEALDSIVDRIDELTDIVNEFAKTQTQINLAIAGHTHVVVPGVAQPSAELLANIAPKEANKMDKVHANIYKHKMKTKFGLKETRLKPTGAKWFGSRFNKTN